jgi:hypothetical protein
MKIGVLLDEPVIVDGFDYVFYEVKPSSGRVQKPLPRAWNVVNCFADNTVSQTKPELVATCKGDKAMRGTARRFLWDWICPSRAEYRDYCLKVIREVAEHEVAGIRLDSACFPREGYCDCATCQEKHRASGTDLIEWRTDQITSFIREVRGAVSCELGLTLEPDPCYGKERFGLDLDRILDYVDFISTPLYMDYSIAYWMDILANCFRRKFFKPYHIELYAGHPRAPIRHLVSALTVAAAYADCIVLSTYQASLAEVLQAELASDKEAWNFIAERNNAELLRIVQSWKKKGN